MPLGRVKDVRVTRKSSDFDRWVEESSKVDENLCLVILYGMEFNLNTLSLVGRCIFFLAGSSFCIQLSYFSFQPVLHDWCNKGRGMCYPVCGMVHIKEPLLLIDKSSLCGGIRFPFSLSEWSLTICLTPYNRR